MKYALLYFCILSLICFFAYGHDKKSAKKHRRRTPELVLLGIGLLGGAVGALLGMRVFHHKTRHWYFWCVNLTAVLCHTMLLWFLFV